MTTPCRSYPSDALSFIYITKTLHQLFLVVKHAEPTYLYICHIHTYYHDTLSFIYI